MNRMDARTLAQLACIDPQPLTGRHTERLTALVNALRGSVKSYGHGCASEAELAAELSVELREVLEPLLVEIESLNVEATERAARGYGGHFDSALLGCSHFYWRLVTRNTLPLPAGNFRPGIGPALMNIHRPRSVKLAME
jgi:hypothetical protein